MPDLLAFYGDARRAAEAHAEVVVVVVVVVVVDREGGEGDSLHTHNP